MAAGRPDRLYQQNHCGMYRSDDGGREWQSIENGLPSDFGFATATHPRDPETAFLLPLVGAEKRYAPDGRLAVWRTRDGGQSWADLRQGLPQAGAFVCVLRQAMATDRCDPAGVYFGTTGGTLFASPTKARAGRRSPSTCRRSGRWRRWLWGSREKCGEALPPRAPPFLLAGKPFIDTRHTSSS
jgi:hypothetical protein